MANIAAHAGFKKKIPVDIGDENPKPKAKKATTSKKKIKKESTN